ncbi:hypothetical protein ACSDR0_14575 [Streptosporangium sp. G11]|uniref:hypothetical protein n=1 Tax=Streptosporangium sp. G11 TaxID=3436926 RepID=UPI003EBC684F
MEEGVEPLGEEWLQRLHNDHRNVVQFSPPTPILADNAREALERVFQHVIIDSVTQSRVRGEGSHAGSLEETRTWPGEIGGEVDVTVGRERL